MKENAFTSFVAENGDSQNDCEYENVMMTLEIKEKTEIVLMLI